MDVLWRTIIFTVLEATYRFSRQRNQKQHIRTIPESGTSIYPVKKNCSHRHARAAVIYSLVYGRKINIQ